MAKLYIKIHVKSDSAIESVFAYIITHILPAKQWFFHSSIKAYRTGKASYPDPPLPAFDFINHIEGTCHSQFRIGRHLDFDGINDPPFFQHQVDNIYDIFDILYANIATATPTIRIQP